MGPKKVSSSLATTPGKLSGSENVRTSSVSVGVGDGDGVGNGEDVGDGDDASVEVTLGDAVWGAVFA